MAKGCGYSSGLKNRTSNSSKGVTYSDGKKSSIALGIGAGKSGSTKIDVGYSAGKDYGDNLQPDPKNKSKPFTQGGRA